MEDRGTNHDKFGPRPIGTWSGPDQTPWSWSRSGIFPKTLDHWNGCLPLSYAAQYGHKVVVKMLVLNVMQDDIKVDTKDKSGRLPLSHAA